MGICLRFSRNHEEAVEIVNDGFIKIFGKLNHYTKGLSFKGWLRKVMVNSAIDYYRKNEKYYHSLDISHGQYEEAAESVLDKLSEREIIAVIQSLPPSYRMVFNLHVIEGFKHDEIAHLLNISTGTSKSNLAIARSKLQKILLTERENQRRREQNG
jgi:RNA polymerase sigma-70 factor (ECF subfamily)